MSVAPTIRGTALRGPAIRWAQSGLMSLTGPEDGAPLVPAFDAMSGVHELMDELRSGAAAFGAQLAIDDGMLGGRAHLMNLRRGGTRSCNLCCRLLEARDGWIALSLPRSSDIELLPAWLGIEAGVDPWAAAAEGVGRFDRAELSAMAEDLPLAYAALPDIAMAVPGAAAASSRFSSTPVREVTADSLLAIDLSALWAGPLCGQLLRRTGMRVIKVESAARPEPARRTLPAFFDLLNAGKESLVLDFDDKSHRAGLRRLIEAADVVISSARPRALEQLDLNPAELIPGRPSLVWIAITAHGWHGSAGQRVGFGDDAAVAAGLVATGDDGRPAFMGDAMADPLTGLSAASAALRACLLGAGGLYDISLRRCAERVAGARRLTPGERGTVRACGADWRLCVGDLEEPVAAPWPSPARNERAAPSGAHTQRILEEIDRGR